MTTHCRQVDPAKLKTNGDLWDAFLIQRAQIDICNGRLDAIRKLAPPPPN